MNKRDLERIKKILENAGISTDEIDLNAEWDNSLSFKENLENLKDKYPIIFNSISTNEVEDLVNHYEIEANNHYVEEIREFEQEEIKKIINNESRVINEIMRIPKSLIRTLLKSDEIHGLIFEGEAGIGKTYTIMQTLQEEGLNLNDYAFLSGYITPLQFYQFLYENKDKKIIFIDDVRGLFENQVNISLLLSALWGVAGIRKVMYNSINDRLGIPREFILNAKIIWATNEIPKNIGHIKSRVFYYRFELSYYDKLKMMYEVAKAKKIPNEVVKFIEENTDETYDIDLRLIFKINSIRKANPMNWQEIAISIFEMDRDKAIVKECLENSGSVKEAIRKFQERTGKSRATFFRIKKELEKSQSLKVSDVSL